MSDILPRGAARSVLPKVSYTRTNEGFRLSEAFDVAVTNISLIVLSLALSIGTLIRFAMLLRDVGSPLVFIGPLFLAVGSFVLWSITINKLRIARTFGPAEVVPDQWPLRLGQRVQVRFRRSVGGDVRVKGVKAALLCREWVRYRSQVRTRKKVRIDLVRGMKRSRTGFKHYELTKDV
jgi:hypothetical protein